MSALISGCTGQTPSAAPLQAPTQVPAQAPADQAAPEKKPRKDATSSRPGGRGKQGEPAAPGQDAQPAPPDQDPLALGKARTPEAVARVLTTAETAIRDTSVRGPALARAGQVQQQVYRLLLRRPGWHRGVLARLPDGLRPIAQRNLGAGVALSSLVSKQRELPDWRIVEPPPAPALLRAYRRAAARFGLEWQYLASINLVETRMGRIRGLSTAGAQGPMQFMPQTWDAYGRGDINDPGDAIEAAARYLAASGAPADMAGALYAYNHSDAYVEAVQAYADVMRADARAYRGYYQWQVYFSTTRGDTLLEVGYGS